MLPTIVSKQLVLLVICLLFTIPARTDPVELSGRDYAVELTANIASDPPEIRLNWRGDQYAQRYTISRKGENDRIWTQIGTVDGPATDFTDREVRIGNAYEYQVIKDSSWGFKGYGYISSGINLPLFENRGTVILLSEATLAVQLAPELLRLEYDLIGDGWSVARAEVRADQSPNEVKSLVEALYWKYGNARSLLLFGHIPVAYSGKIMPDGHTNHLGAWPADVFYADVDGAWTDKDVDSSEAEQPRQWNVTGDGKFDQSKPPSSIELETGRVDLSRLTSFQNKNPSRSELDLARQYLRKNHLFRTGGFPVEQRAIIFDRIESKTAEPVAAMAWRNFAPFVGSQIEKIGDLEYFPKVSSGTYLWSSVCAGGGYTSSDHVGTSDAFAMYDANVVFTTFLGSYFGDWDVESSFLRSALGGSGTLLATVYSGQPQWLFHPVAMGKTIGYSARITQENGFDGLYPPHNNGAGEVHIALLGDPTLRAHPLPVVQNVRTEQTPEGTVIKWEPPRIEGVTGFLVYRSPNAKGPYEKITPEPVAQQFWTIPAARPEDTYMVKAVALTRTPSGSYYNSSVGTYYPDPLTEVSAVVPAAPTSLSVTRVSSSSVTLAWVQGSAVTSGYRLERRNFEASSFQEIANLSADTFLFDDTSLPGAGTYIYRIWAYNQAGSSPYSNEATGSTLGASAEFVGIDSARQGDWIGPYGNDGFIIPSLNEQMPSYVSMTTSNVLVYRPALASDPRAMQLTNSTSRSANCWAQGTPFAFHLNFTDDQIHQISFYMFSWNRNNPGIGVDVVDAVSGALLDSRVYDHVDDGVYAIYNLRRQVYVTLSPPSIWTNAEVYGVFFDPVRVAPVQITPNGGSFVGRVQLNLECLTRNATIRFTVDGSEPTEQSLQYTGPIWLDSDAHLKARAFRDGFPPSPVAEASFQDEASSVAGIISSEVQTGGAWRSKYGSEGYWLAGSNSMLPQFARATLDGVSLWTWGDQPGDARALIDGSADQSSVQAWYSSSVITLDLSVFDTRTHAISLYFLDFDRLGREQELQLYDSSGMLLDRFTVNDFGNGSYVTLAIQGEVRVKILPTAGPNAVLNGIFLDSAKLSLTATPLMGAQINGGLLKFNVAAFPGLKICTDRSQDLKTWQCIATNLVTGKTATVSVPFEEFSPNQFFRTHLSP